jgi:hypothetical protein
MSAINPSGEEKHWINGEPAQPLYKSDIDSGSQKYWVNGEPITLLVPASGASATNTAKNGSFFLLFG